MVAPPKTRMKLLVLFVALLLSACDRWMSVQYLVTSSVGDSTAAQSTQIANDLAQRHGLGPRALDKECGLASFEATSSPSHNWELCVDQGNQNVSVLLLEWLATEWSPKGDSLQRELRDTLQARFGDRAREVQ